MRKNAKYPLRYRIKYLFSGYKTQNLLLSLRKKVPILALILVLTLSLCYIAIHPLDKIKLKYFFTHDFTIEISVRPATPLEHSFLSHDTKIIIDGDLMQVHRTDHVFDDNTYYYKLEGDGIYQYYKDANGRWQHELIRTVDSESMDFIINSELLDRSNYKRVKGELFAWELKENEKKTIDRYIVSNIKVKRVQGNIALVGDATLNGGDCRITISFSKFGRSDVKPPWENS